MWKCGHRRGCWCSVVVWRRGRMSQPTQQRLYDFAKMALINIFAHPYATVRHSSFPFNWQVHALILTLIHSRCATCTVEMPTLINGPTHKLATTLELVLPFSSSQSHLSFPSINYFCCFCRCAFVWDRPNARNLGDSQEILHCRVLWAWPLHGDQSNISIYAIFHRVSFGGLHTLYLSESTMPLTPYS